MTRVATPRRRAPRPGRCDEEALLRPIRKQPREVVPPLRLGAGRPLPLGACRWWTGIRSGRTGSADTIAALTISSCETDRRPSPTHAQPTTASTQRCQSPTTTATHPSQHKASNQRADHRYLRWLKTASSSSNGGSSATMSSGVMPSAIIPITVARPNCYQVDSVSMSSCTNSTAPSGASCPITAKRATTLPAAIRMRYCGLSENGLGRSSHPTAKRSTMRSRSSTWKSFVDGSPFGPRSAGSWRSRSSKNRWVARTVRLPAVTGWATRCLRGAPRSEPAPWRGTLRARR